MEGYKERFTDGSLERGSMLNAVDICDVLLDTLEESCRPLVGEVPDIQDHVNYAYMWAESQDSFHHVKDVEQAAAINLYTQEWTLRENSLYYKLNLALRSEDRTLIKPYFGYLRLFFEAMQYLPNYLHTPTIWRSMKDVVDYRKDKKLFWWGVSSCTTDMTVLNSFLGKDLNTPRTIFNIHTSSAVQISQFSNFKMEAEVILLPGRYLEVLNVLQQGTLTIVEVREIQPRAPLIKYPVLNVKREISTLDDRERELLLLKQRVEILTLERTESEKEAKRLQQEKIELRLAIRVTQNDGEGFNKL